LFNFDILFTSVRYVRNKLVSIAQVQVLWSMVVWRVNFCVNNLFDMLLMETYYEIASNTSRTGSRTWNAAALITLHPTVRRVKNWNRPKLSRVGLKPERLRMSKQRV